MESSKPHVVIVSSPGMGHVTPCLELAKCLASHHAVEVSLFVPSIESTVLAQFLQSLTLPKDLHLLNLPPVDVSTVDPTADTNLVAHMLAVTQKSLPALRSAILECPRRPTVIIADLFSTNAFELAADLKMDKYLFSTCSATTFAYIAYSPKLAQEIDIDGLAETIEIPGCKQVRIEDLEGRTMHRDSMNFRYMLGQICNYVEASGVLVNTFNDLEHQTLEGLSDDSIRLEIPVPPLYPVGPLIKSSSLKNSDCLTWLDKQPRGSVIFVAFGSGGTMSFEQIYELAWGLELSKQRFLWAIRPPQQLNPATYMTAGLGQYDPSVYLPDGFLTRTQGVGHVVPSWVPQIDILSHESVGAFITHCGWNSTLESIVHGVLLITWPMYAEQNWNALMLAEDIGVAVRLGNAPENGLVGREKIESTVRLVMGHKGKILRNKAKQLRHSAIGATGKGGSSYDSLSKLVRKWSARKSFLVDMENC